jgi:aminoglycoside phosphotransferase family enzyme
MNHPRLVESMMRPEFYPHNPDTVELIQTHISYIFIAGDLVYKVKKAVDFGFLDFTTLGKMKYYCDKEVLLNQRFAPHVYRNVVRIIEDPSGDLRMSNGNRIVEYAVEMEKIPEERMLYRLIEEKTVKDEDIRRVGKYLAGVYRNIQSDEKARSFGTVKTISINVVENFDQTRKYIGGPVNGDTLAAIETWSVSFMKNHSSLFEKRIVDGHIKDCHGDLHLQHICIDGDRISIFDCIEFNERFRYGDVASDVAFLSMDFDFNDRKDLAEIFVEAYGEESGDPDLTAILPFYKIYRAMVRAKVTSFLLDDTALDDAARNAAFLNAQRYYDLAYGYVSHED